MSGTLNSVNTNTGAMIALDALDATNSSLNSVQKQISTAIAWRMPPMTARPMPWPSRSARRSAR